MNLIYVSIEYLRKLGNPQPSLGTTKFWGWSAKKFQTKRTPGLAHLPSLFGYGGGEVGITYSRS